MTRSLALALSCLALLSAGCGDTCGSRDAPIQNGPSSCSVAPGATANIQVRLCSSCKDSGPSCQAEFLGGQVEVAPTFRQCSENAGCTPGSGCELTDSIVTCAVTAPTTPGSYPIVGASGTVGTLVVTTGATGCSL